MYLDKEKLPIIYEALRENQVDAWLITGRESIMKSEPVLPVLGDMDFIIATTLIFTAEGKCIAIVSPLDVEGYKLIEGIDEVVEYQTTMEESIYEVLSKLKPKRLALDYSSSDAAADGLSVYLPVWILKWKRSVLFRSYRMSVAGKRARRLKRSVIVPLRLMNI